MKWSVHSYSSTRRQTQLYGKRRSFCVCASARSPWQLASQSIALSRIVLKIRPTIDPSLWEEAWSAQFRHLHRLEIAIFMDVYRQIDFDFVFAGFVAFSRFICTNGVQRHTRSVVRMWNFGVRENMCSDYFRLWMSIWCTQGHVRNVNERTSERAPRIFAYKAAHVNILLFVHVNSVCMQTIPICILKTEMKNCCNELCWTLENCIVLQCS